MGRYHHRSNNINFIDNSVVVRLNRLFRIYKKIPETHIPLLFYKCHREIFDVKLCRDDLNGMIRVSQIINGVPIYELRPVSDPLSDSSCPETTNTGLRAIRTRKRKIAIEHLMNPELPLWSDFKHLLQINKSQIQIDQSPFEIVLLKDAVRTKQHIATFHNVLKEHPNGVKTNELCTLFVNLKESFELFGAPDVCSITQEYFELFHVKDVAGSSVPRVFDGRTTTYEDLHDKVKDSQKLAATSLLSGLYQKTLLLLSRTDLDGMKLGVWHGSVKSNFGEYDPVVQPLTLLKAWRDEGLISIRPGTYYLNDLMINFPEQKVDTKYTHATKGQLTEMVDTSLSN